MHELLINLFPKVPKTLMSATKFNWFYTVYVQPFPPYFLIRDFMAACCCKSTQYKDIGVRGHPFTEPHEKRELDRGIEDVRTEGR